MNLDFRIKRSDTKVATIEATYSINLGARSDMLLENLLVASRQLPDPWLAYPAAGCRSQWKVAKVAERIQ